MFNRIARIIDIIPKKFIVWLTALVLFLVGLINPSQFTTITITYISANIVAKYTPKARALSEKLSKEDKN